MNLESLVSVCQHRTENASLFLAHTARRFMGVVLVRGMFSRAHRALGLQLGRSRNKVAVGEPAAGSPPSWRTSGAPGGRATGPHLSISLSFHPQSRIGMPPFTRQYRASGKARKVKKSRSRAVDQLFSFSDRKLIIHDFTNFKDCLQFYCDYCHLFNS